MLNQRQVDATLMNQSGVAKRVYDCVPIQDTWDVPAILRAVKLANGGNVPDRKVISGCLNDLTDSGLIRRTGRDLYKRTAIRPDTVKQPTLSLPVPAAAPVVQPTDDFEPETIEMQTPAIVQPAANAAPVALDALAILGNVSDTINAMGEQLIALSTQVVELALQVEEERELVRKKNADLDQLRKLLKALQAD